MAFDYGTFFDSAVTGEVWLPADDVHYQDAGRTTPSVDGDPVGSLTGNRGNFHASEYTGSNPPILRQHIDTAAIDTAEPGKWYLEFWGEPLIAGTVADWNYLHHYVGNQAYCCLAVQVALDSNPESRYDFLATGIWSSSSVGINWYWDDAGSVEERVRFNVSAGIAFAFTATTNNNTLAPLTDAILEITRDGQTLTGYVNGTQIFTGTQSLSSGGNSANPLTIGARGNGANGLYGRIYGLLVCDTLPDADTWLSIRSDMDSRLATPTGAFRQTVALPAGNITFSGLSLPRPNAVPIGQSVKAYRLKIEISGVSPEEIHYLAPVNWQSRYAYDRANYLSVALHNLSTDLIEAMTDALGLSPEAGAVTITIQSGFRYPDGTAYYFDLMSSAVQTVQNSSGPSSVSTVLSGYQDAASASPKSVSLGSANTIRSGNVARGWIGPIDDNIAPGDLVTLTDTGESWVVGNISYRVDARSGVMEVSELTNADLLAELPW